MVQLTKCGEGLQEKTALDAFWVDILAKAKTDKNLVSQHILNLKYQEKKSADDEEREKQKKEQETIEKQ